MRKPRPEAYDPKAKYRHPDAVDLTGVVPLIPKASLEKEVYNASLPSGVETAQETTVSRYHGIMPPPSPEFAQDTERNEIMKTVRKAVKEFGKEAATYRFTLMEKKALGEI